MRAKLLYLIVHMIAWLPLSFSRGLGKFAAMVSCFLSSRAYKVTKQNLEIVYPHLNSAERIQMVRESMSQSAQMVAETGSVWFRGDAWRASKTLSVEGEDKLFEANSSGKGVLVLLPHFGNWEMVGIRIAQTMPSTAMYAPPKLKELEPIMLAGRFAAELVPANVKGVAKTFKALQRGELTFVLPDQVPAAESGIFAPFFGHPALTMTLIHRLVNKAKPVVLAAYAIRKPGGFDIGYMDPDPKIYSDNEEESVLGLNRTIEKMIEKAPTQYQWEYKHFRQQPDGKSPYRGY